jgi:hypothetical protein
MKNLYRPSFQKVLLFCLLLLSCQLTFAQTLPDPTGLTTNQIVCYNEEVDLTSTGSCASGTLKWYDGLLSTTEITDLVFNVTTTTTIYAACVSSCTCEMSNSVPVTFTVNLPFNVTRSQSTCDCEVIDLKAECPSGIVSWYAADSTTFISSGSPLSTQPGSSTTYTVRCEDAANSCNSPFKTIDIYVNTTLNSSAIPMADTTICAGSGIILKATCDVGAQPFFYLNDEVTEIDSVINSVTANTIYKVRCESFTACKSPFSNINISVSVPAGPTINTPAEICFGERIFLDATCGTDFRTAWYNDDEVTPLLSPLVTPGSNITYKVRCESMTAIGCFSPFDTLALIVRNEIITQPTSALICLGDAATFAIVVDNTDSPTLQWQKKQADGTFIDIPSATNDTLTITNTTLTDQGHYRCHVVGHCNFYSEEVFLIFPGNIALNGKPIPSQIAPLEGYGSAVAVSDSIAVVGAFQDNSGKGAAYVFKLNANGKWTQSARLAPSDLLADDIFGSAVAIAGNHIFVSAVGYNSFSGKVYIFKKQSNNSWLQIDKILSPDGSYPDDYFGGAIAASDSLLAIGADGYEVAYIYKMNFAGVWEFEDYLEDGTPGNEFSYSIGISGNDLVIGAPDEGASGAIFIYERLGAGIWMPKGQFTPDSLNSGAYFGSSLSVSGNKLIVAGDGVAQIYEKDLVGNWNEKVLLSGNDLVDDDLSDLVVSIDNEIAVIGTPMAGKGVAVIYEKNVTGNWVKKKTLTPADLINGDHFGSSVAVSKNTIVVGSLFTPVSLEFGTGGAYFYNIYASPIPAVSSITQASSYCPAQSVTFNLTGLPVVDTYTITYKIDVAGTENTVIVTPDTLGKASFTQVLNWVDNTKSIYITKIKNNTTNCEKLINVSSAIAVKAPTLITAHPTAEIVCLGETAVFMAEATGEGLLSFQWQRQAPVISGVNSPFTNDFADISVLTLQNRTLSDNGAKYRVKITGECGVAISNDALLTVLAKATASIAASGPICPGTTATLTFTGTPYAQVIYQRNGTNSSVTLDASGNATATTVQLASQTTYNLVSINVEGKCNQMISGSAVVEVLTSGVNPPLTLTSPVHDVLPNGKQTHAAQTIDAFNKIEAGGKSTIIGNKAVTLQPGFESKEGSVYTAKIAGACI